MRVLILTDHTQHTDANSFYGIANALNRHPEINSVDIASRKDQRNAPFFVDLEDDGLWTYRLKGSISLEGLEKDLITGAYKNISNFDVILLRLPRPVDHAFFQFLGMVFPEKYIINRPSGIEKTSNKAFLLSLNRFVPPVAMVESWKEIESFAQRFPTVLKPLKDYGGRGLVKIEHGMVWYNDEEMTMDVYKEIYLKNPHPFLAMKFLKNVTKGDKRIVVADGKVLACALRTPAPGHWLCNISQGGSSVLAQPDQDEQAIVHYLNPILKKEGIFLYGIDTLVDDTGKRVISEINTLSVGGITPSEAHTGLPLTKIFAERFVHYCHKL